MTDLLTQEVVVGDTPGSPNGAIAPIKGTQGLVKADLRRQYVAGSGLAWYAAMRISLKVKFALEIWALNCRYWWHEEQAIRDLRAQYREARQEAWRCH